MLLLNSLRQMARRATARRRGSRLALGRRSQSRRPAVEVLEDRTLLSIVYAAVAAGDATSHDAILWTRAQDSGTTQGIALTALVSTDQNFGSGVFYTGATDPTEDYIMKVEATGLESGTRYYYRFLAGDGT